MMIGVALASRLARVALSGITREYPHKLDHVHQGPSDLRAPRELHPAFYGCYDWHSAVHSHWMLARLTRVCPELPERAAVLDIFASHFARAPLAAELAYIQEPGRAGFERPYGWAWFMQLTAEIAALDIAEAAAWHARLAPIAGVFAARLIAHLPRQTWPIRAGTHVNTAFALALAWDYSQAAADAALADAVRAGALRFFEGDRDGPANYEPSGNDFLSPCLTEADLMRRFHEPVAYARWLARFLPGFLGGTAARLLEPVIVSDRADAQGVHLDGLNLSRAWCLAGIADHLPDGDTRIRALRTAARSHLEAGLAHVDSGDFLAEHWLGSFAVHALTCGDHQGTDRAAASLKLPAS